MRILIVDGDKALLESLSKEIRELEPNWFVDTTESPIFALEILEQRTFDILITSLRMPHTIGDQLLKHVRISYPHMIRFLFTDGKSVSDVISSQGLAHQYIPKPCDVGSLIQSINRAFSLRNILRNENVKNFVNKTTRLPALPESYRGLVNLLASEDYNVNEVVSFLEKDIGLTAHVLKVANSASIAARGTISNLKEAITILGTETIKAIVLASSVFSSLDLARYKKFQIEALWQHSIEVGGLAASIAASHPDTARQRDNALTAGILHDVGKLIFILNQPLEYRRCMTLEIEKGLPNFKAEKKVLGVSHEEAGAYLLGLWGLPDVIVEAVLFHHHPSACSFQQRSVLTCVAAANCIAHEVDTDTNSHCENFENYLRNNNLFAEYQNWNSLKRA